MWVETLYQYYPYACSLATYLHKVHILSETSDVLTIILKAGIKVMYLLRAENL